MNLHLSGILIKNSLVNALNFQQRSIYRDVFVLLLRAFVELLHFADTFLQKIETFQLCGRKYPFRILQQRNCELFTIIMINLLTVRAFCPSNIKAHWEAVIRIYQLFMMKVSHLNHKVGNEIELRNKLLDSHCRYQSRNFLIILNILNDMSQHPFTVFQKINGFASASLTTLRKVAVLMKSLGFKTNATNATEVSSEQAATDIKAAKRI